MSDSTTPLTPAQPVPLPPAVAAAIHSAAQRIADQAGSLAITHDSPDAAGLEEIITEALRPVLLGGPLPPFDASVERVAPAIHPLFDQNHDGIVAPVLGHWAGREWIVVTTPQRRGCIGTRYCHVCKVSYGGTCLCLPNKCHHCGAECGTTPPAEGEKYRHEIHY